MVIKVEYFNGTKKQFNTIDDVADPLNVKYLDCMLNDLKSIYTSAENTKYFQAGCATPTGEGLEKFVNLRKLDCGYNDLESLSINNIYLEELNCSGNKLTKLEINNLVNLKILYCHRNELTSFEGIDNLTNLQELWCEENKLTSLESIKNLTNLHVLMCKKNNITSINGIENLVNLTDLNISRNKLTSIKGIGSLVNLETLFLAYNDVTEIPIELINLRNLEDFNFYDNPIDYIPPIIQRFIDGLDEKIADHRIYENGQNVHDSTINAGIRESIYKLLQNKVIPYDILISLI